jgi:hypothetical protein
VVVTTVGAAANEAERADEGDQDQEVQLLPRHLDLAVLRAG